jgi:tetratricopeptide (TPR) repeat protein
VALPVVLVLAALAIAAPWQAERDIVRAGEIFAAQPLLAYDKLERAADLDPLSDRPLLVEGSIALRFGDLPRADRAFARALERNPRGFYATLERGAIASVRGDERRARALLRRALALAPRDPLAQEAELVAREGGAVDLTELNRRILEGAAGIGG